MTFKDVVTAYNSQRNAVSEWRRIHPFRIDGDPPINKSPEVDFVYLEKMLMRAAKEKYNNFTQNQLDFIFETATYEYNYFDERIEGMDILCDQFNKFLEIKD